jgi:hypothetical protein
VWFIMSLIVPGARKGGSRAGLALDGTNEHLHL